MPGVTAILSDSGCVFKHVLDVPPNTTFHEFKDRVESFFDQRLQLSFKKRIDTPGYVASAESSEWSANHKNNNTVGNGDGGSKTQLNLESLLKRSRIQPYYTSQVALCEKTWNQFISHKNPRCRVWTVFPGVSLKVSAAKVITREQRIQQFEAGSENLNKADRLKVLKKKLHTMHISQQRKEDNQGASLGKSLDLFKSLAQDQRDLTVERLWKHATDKNQKRAEEELRENERVLKRLVHPSRNLNRTAEQEQSIERLFEQPLQRKAQLEAELDSKYEPLFDRPCTLPSQEISETVLRLYSDANENQRRRKQAQQRIYGKHIPERKLTPEQLNIRLQSVCTSSSPF